MSTWKCGSSEPPPSCAASPSPMRIRCGYEIRYDCPSPSPMVLMLNIRPEREPDLVTPQVMSNDRGVPMHAYVDGFGNICTRVLAPEGRITFSADFVLQDSGEPDPV